MLPLDAKIKLVSALVNDFVDCAENNTKVPQARTYNIESSDEGMGIKREARAAAFSAFDSPMVKLAFDTRRVNQETDRNPRQNLQYWHRSEAFITEEDQGKLKTFAKLYKVLEDTKKKLGTQPEWFESYTRQLYDNVGRILRVKQADLDIFRPQLSYLEQLIFARYRVSMEELEKLSEEKILNKILAKDEGLIGRANYLKETTGEDKKETVLTKDGLTKTTQDSIVNAIFGADNLRKDGEKTVERTITISIRDRVLDE